MLLLLWLLGGVAFPVGTQLVHALIVIVIGLVLVRLLRGKPLA